MQIYSDELELPDRDHLEMQFSACLHSGLMALLSVFRVRRNLICDSHSCLDSSLICDILQKIVSKFWFGGYFCVHVYVCSMLFFHSQEQRFAGCVKNLHLDQFLLAGRIKGN